MAGSLNSCWPYLVKDRIHCDYCEGKPVANMLDARCTCPQFWRGITQRPLCVVHEEAEIKKSEKKKKTRKKKGRQ